MDILRAARMLFWKHGFKRITIEEICREAGVSKMTFYRFFPHKLELAKTVMKKVFDENITEFRNILTSEQPAPEKLKAMLQLKIKGTHDISPEFMQDFYNSQDTGLMQFIAEQSALVWNEMVIDFREAQQKGVFRKDLNLEFFILFARKSMEVATDDHFKNLFSTPEELILELTNLFIYGIAPREDEN
ncbi:MAG: TetR/AcrR family transcriptional regulator [Bacteroidales bacterium]